MMNIPLLLAAIAYATGVVAGNYLALPLAASLAMGLGMVGGALLPIKRREVFLGLSLFSLGFCNERLQIVQLSPHDLRVLVGTKPVYVTLTGTLTETPYQKFYEHRQEVAWRTLATMDVENLMEEGRSPCPAFGRVAVSTPGVLGTNFFKGSRFSVSGVLSTPMGPAAEDLFDYKSYLERQGVYYQLQVKSTAEWGLMSSNAVPPYADRFLSWAQRTLARGLPEEDEALQLLWAMTLGWKTALSGDVPEPFMRSGTMHVFAISGLHIALIAGILVALFRVFKIPRGACALVVLPLIWFYTVVTGFQASAVRSTVMMTVIIVGWGLHRPSNLMNSLGAAALIILLYDPQQLFQASFQLSFFVVLSLALFVPILEQLRQKLLAPDPFLPKELRPKWRKRLDWPINYATTSFVTSLAAWLGSIPLVAYYFHLFTPVSLLANLVVVPLSSGALASNLASLICGDWLPAQGEIFNHAAWGFMKGMIVVSEWSAHWAPGSFHIPAPGLIGFAIYYAALIGVMNGWFREPRWQKPLLASLGCLCLLWSGLKCPELFTTKVTILPTGGGQVVFVDDTGHRNDWLIDCGEEDKALHLTKPFLQGQGVNCVHRMVLTHGDVKHVGGANPIRQMFGVPEVFLSPVRFRSKVYREIVAKLSEMKVERKVKLGDKLGLWEVLHPAEKSDSTQADDNAIVLRGDIRGTKLLLLSDLGKRGQNTLSRNHTNLQADIVVSGIPVQTEPVANLFLDLIQPKLIIITDALFPASARASTALRQRLSRKGIPVIYTSETGAVTLELKQNCWRATTMSGLSVKSSEPGAIFNANASRTPLQTEPEESQTSSPQP